MDSGRISVRGAVAEALAFWRESWRSALASLVAVALTALLIQMLPQQSLELALAYIAYAVAGLMAQGALFRLALARGGVDVGKPGPGGLQWGRLEWRLLGVGLLTALVFIIVMAVAMFLGMAATAGMVDPDALAAATTPQELAAALPPAASRILIALLAAVVVLLVWLALRLSMAAPATVAEGRIRLFSTWRMTGGHVLTLLGAAALIYLPLAILDVLASLIDTAAVKLGGGGWAGIVSTAVGLFFYLPISVGLLSHFYLRLREPAGDA